MITVMSLPLKSMSISGHLYLPLEAVHTMGPALNEMGNKKIYQNNYFRPHFHFLICLVFPGIPLVKIFKKYLDISNIVFTMNSSADKKSFSGYFYGRASPAGVKNFNFVSQAIPVFFAKISYIFITNLQISFFWLNIRSFTTVQTKQDQIGLERISLESEKE